MKYDSIPATWSEDSKKKWEEYLISLRIKTAKALLTRTGYTPKQYRSKFYNKNIS